MITAGTEPVVVLHVDVADKIGMLEALLLAQIDYWVERSHRYKDGHFWVYNTLAEWGRQLSLSPWQVKRAANHLEKLGLIKRRRLNPVPYDRTHSYTVCYEKLREMGFTAGRRGILAREAGDPWDKPLEDRDFWQERSGADKWAM